LWLRGRADKAQGVSKYRVILCANQKDDGSLEYSSVISLATESAILKKKIFDSVSQLAQLLSELPSVPGGVTNVISLLQKDKSFPIPGHIPISDELAGKFGWVS
jgi:hypothetical protein